MQRARRTNPYPFTWEIPVSAITAAVLVLVLGVHAGRAVANMVAGAGLTWPSRELMFVSVPAVLGGDAAAGLDGPSAHLAGATAVVVWVVVVETLLLAMMLWGVKAGLDRWGPGRIHGMASREDAARLLGRRRLRKAAPVVRPDLYGKRR